MAIIAAVYDKSVTSGIIIMFVITCLLVNDRAETGIVLDDGEILSSP
jgi:hypothetical protein